MKNFVSLVRASTLGVSLLFGMLTSSAGALASANGCLDPLTQQDIFSGTNNSSNGPAGFAGLSVWQYINPLYAETFPQLVRLVRLDDGNVQACVYDRHFGQTNAAHLVTVLSCTGGQNMSRPYADNLRVRCQGSLGADRLNLEVTFLRLSLVASMYRVAANGAANTEAVLLGR